MGVCVDVSTMIGLVVVTGLITIAAVGVGSELSKEVTNTEEDQFTGITD